MHKNLLLLIFLYLFGSTNLFGQTIQLGSFQIGPFLNSGFDIGFYVFYSERGSFVPITGEPTLFLGHRVTSVQSGVSLYANSSTIDFGNFVSFLTDGIDQTIQIGVQSSSIVSPGSLSSTSVLSGLESALFSRGSQVDFIGEQIANIELRYDEVFGTTSGSATLVVNGVVPIPAAFWLLGSSIGLLTIFRRKQKLIYCGAREGFATNN